MSLIGFTDTDFLFILGRQGKRYTVWYKRGTRESVFNIGYDIIHFKQCHTTSNLVGH